MGLYINNGDGSFGKLSDGSAIVTDSFDSTSAVWGDYDGDGDLDLFVVNSGQANNLYINNGFGFGKLSDGSAIVTDSFDSRSAVWGDYDGDGDLDLFVANEGLFVILSVPLQKWGPWER